MAPFKSDRRQVLQGAAGALWLQLQPPQSTPNPREEEEEDKRLPNGKSQKNAIAKENHQRALEDTEELLQLANALKSELEKAGDYVVPLASVKRTEEIEKLAKRIRNRLKA